MSGISVRFSARAQAIVIAALSVLALLVLTACGSQGSSSAPSRSEAGTQEKSASVAGVRSLDEIKDSGTVRIGVFSDKAPFGFVDSNGEFAGYDVEYGRRIAEDLGVTPEFVTTEAASRVEFVDTGKVDVLLANFTVTPERQEKVDFANPYMKVALGAVTPDSAPINDPADLVGKKVIVVKGTTAESYLEAKYPEVDLVKFEQYTEASNALIDGRADAWVTDNTEALAFANASEGFSATIPTMGDIDTIAPAVKKGNTALLDWLNEHQVELAKEEFFHKDFDKTLKPVYGDGIAADDLVVEGGQL
ncbi:MAG: transporter substrate-binding domain-containing protein [Corynebacterium sp.]|nr:transporter substrate-binding domain-containing protein [Corynebacterium sp.]